MLCKKMFYNTNFCVLQASFFALPLHPKQENIDKKDEKSIIITDLYLRFRYA